MVLFYRSTKTTKISGVILNIRATQATLQTANAIITFTDGHRLVMTPRFGSLGHIIGLSQITLLQANHPIVTFYPLIDGVRQQPDKVGFEYDVDGWTPRRFADYLTAGFDYVRSAHVTGQLGHIWAVVLHAQPTLFSLQNYDWPMNQATRATR